MRQPVTAVSARLDGGAGGPAPNSGMVARPLSDIPAGFLTLAGLPLLPDEATRGSLVGRSSVSPSCCLVMTLRNWAARIGRAW